MADNLQVFASVHETGRGPQFNEFVLGLDELGVDFYATGGTATAIRDLDVPAANAWDLLEQAGYSPDLIAGMKRPALAGALGGIIAAGETDLDLLITGTRPPNGDHADIDFGSPTYELGAYKAGIAIATGPQAYRSVLRWLRAGQYAPETMMDILRSDVDMAGIDFHQQAWRHVRRRLASVAALGDTGSF